MHGALRSSHLFRRFLLLVTYEIGSFEALIPVSSFLFFYMQTNGPGCHPNSIKIYHAYLVYYVHCVVFLVSIQPPLCSIFSSICFTSFSAIGVHREVKQTVRSPTNSLCPCEHQSYNLKEFRTSPRHSCSEKRCSFVRQWAHGRVRNRRKCRFSLDGSAFHFADTQKQDAH